ncbi:lamina-associated polypeptide 2, isoforms beta/gamma-like isoform X3 [Sinocyclocheilus rhinocerous]|uniref:Lamina-associated polypeptide 2, isoforms beta/gamma-like n=1 Tax=Sinocyclocheilus rhinocerous TaxID=307959 RepID=A0A673I7F6_9TELE|nr:PREDICTED: lamina-associated polypeptide 2, isoforms beta/gamma-like isoform X3 [Sinocyclocheilus rhinocerous]
MSEFLEDPSVLTKDKLKSALLAHNVALPNGDQKKDVYVQLYLKNLSAQNKKSSGSPDVFSSDEELPPAPVVSNRSRSGRKATRKTDKVRPEDVDVTELSNDALKDLLLKYGLNAGPIVASTRKVYEKRLQKLLDQGPPETVTPPSETSQTDGSQNGNTDSDQYSDKEEETVAPAPVFVPEPEPEVVAEPIPVVERPIRSRGKTPVTSRTRSGQHNRENSELSSAEYFPVTQDRRRTGLVATRKEPRPLLTDKTSKLSSKTEFLRRRSAPVRSYRPDLNEAPVTDKDFSESSVLKEVSIPLVRMKVQPLVEPKDPKPSKRSSMSATNWAESLKWHNSPYQSALSGLHGATPADKFDENAAEFTSPLIRPSNREPLVSLLNTACVEVDGQGMQDILNCRPSSRSPVAQEVKSVTVSKLSKPHLSQTKPSKPLMDMVIRLSPSCDGRREVFPSHSVSFRDSSPRTVSEDSLPVSYDHSQESFGSPKTKTRQSKITPFFSQITSVRGLDSSQTETPKTAMVEKVSAIDQTPRTVERDVLKEIFPNENLSTPTGISATCRRPIRGAAGRPLVGDTWLDESRLRLKELRETSSFSTYTETRSVPRVTAVPLTASKPVAPPAVKTRARRSLPVWVQLLLLTAVAGFLFFVYQAMETNEVGLFKQSGADDGTSK